MHIQCFGPAFQNLPVSFTEANTDKWGPEQGVNYSDAFEDMPGNAFKYTQHFIK